MFQKLLRNFYCGIDWCRHHVLVSISVVLIFFISSATHFIWLDTFPPGMAHDEVLYTLSSKIFALHGTDLSGYGFPLALFKTETEGNISIVPVMLLSVVHAILPLTQAIARFPYALLSLFTAGALYFLSFTLFKNKLQSIIISLLFLISPWGFFLSHFATESPFALFFYVVGITLLLRERGWKLVFPLIFLSLGFFSYHGAKLLFLPVIFTILFYRLTSKDKDKLNKKEAGIYSIASLVIVLAFYAICQFIPGSILSNRVGEIFFSDSTTISKAVNDQRKLAISNPLEVMFSNKLTVIGTTFMDKYLGAFSPQVLFISGDSRLIYTFYHHGLLYVIDILFLGIGFVMLFRHFRKIFYLLLALFLIAPLASGVNGVTTSYVHRSFLLLPLFMIVIGVGIYELLYGFQKKISRYCVIAVILLFYSLSFANFNYFYFFRYPITASEAYSLSERLMAKYVTLAQSEKKNIVIVGTTPGDIYLEYLFYANDKKALQEHIGRFTDFNKGSFRLHNLEFLGGCPKTFNKNTIYIINHIATCNTGLNAVFVINDPKDAGALYVIYNSSLCKKFTLSAWNRYHLRSDFAIEKMNSEQFCTRWISPSQ